MTRDVISKNIIERIRSHPKTRKMKIGAIRVGISDIHKDNPGIRMNAAAHLFAKKKRFSIYNLLSDEDKASLSFVAQSRRRAFSTESEKKIRTPRRHPIEPDFKSPFVREASDNLEPYFYVYLLENGLRKVILDKFGQDETWWKDERIVPRRVREYSERIKEAEKEHPWVNPRASHSIYYVGLFELFRIIENSWSVFKGVFNNLEYLRAWLGESIPIRNLVAHNVKTRPLDRQNIKIRTDSICRAYSEMGREATNLTCRLTSTSGNRVRKSSNPFSLGVFPRIAWTFSSPITMQTVSSQARSDMNFCYEILLVFSLTKTSEYRKLGERKSLGILGHALR